MPTRSRAHILETISVRKFLPLLPAEWTDTEPRRDYGIDLMVHVFDPATDGGDAKPTGIEFGVQLKATDDETSRSMRVGVSWGHIAYWQSLPYPVLVVRYRAVDDTFFGMWVHERGRRPNDAERRQAWFHFEQSDLLDESAIRSLPPDVLAFRAARSGAIHLPLEFRLDADEPASVVQLGLNTELAHRVGAGSIRLDASSSSPLKVSLAGGAFTVDLGGGVALHAPRLADNATYTAADVLFGVGICLGRTGAWTDAARCLKAAADSALLNDDLLLAAAAAFLCKAREFMTAVGFIEDSAARSGGDAFAWMSLLRHLPQMEGDELARLEAICLGRIEDADNDVDLGVAHFNYAAFLRGINHQIEAMLTLETAAQYNPAYLNRADYWAHLGGSQFASGEYAMAASSYLRSINLGEDSPEVRTYLAEANLYAGNYRTLAELPVDIEPTSDELLINLIATFVIERFGLDTQERQTESGYALLQTQPVTEEVVREAAMLDALLPGCWAVSSMDTGAPEEMVQAAIFLLIAARLEGDSSELWSAALIWSFIGGASPELLRAAVDVAHTRAGVSVGSALLDLTSAMRETDPGLFEELDLTPLFALVNQHRVDTTAPWTITEVISGESIRGRSEQAH